MNDVLITLGSAATQTFTYGGLIYNVIGDPVNTGGAAAPIVADLVDLDDVATGISFFQTQGTDSTLSSGVAQDGTGDAFWVKTGPSASLWFESSGVQRIFGYGNLDPTHTYRFEGFSSRDSTGSRPTSWTVGGNTQTIESIGNSSETAIFTGIAPDANNQIIITTESGGDGTQASYTNALRLVDEGVASGPTTRKGSTFTVDKPGTLGTITTATLNAVDVFDHLTAQDATTATFAGALTDEITTSGEYALVLGDGTVTETIQVQVNVYGVVPSNNPLRVQGTAQSNLTSVQIRVTDGASLDDGVGTQLYYTGTGTTDANGNLSNIDLNSTSVVEDDLVEMHLKTASGESIIATETVGLI